MFNSDSFTSRRRLLGTGSFGVLLTTILGLATAHAQSDIERPLPNVLLLVDTSGSMEFRAEDNQLPVCTPGNPLATNEKSRWIDLVEVMTGTINNYSCFPMNRSTAAFAAEYGIGGTPPYDWNYVNPFHRIVSGNCTVGPGQLPPTSNPYAFPTNGVAYLPFTAPATVNRPASFTNYNPCSFSQAQDGILDVFKEKVRFGLMTFDTHANAGTGLTATKQTDVASGFAGTWSYFVGASPSVGRPANCSVDQPQEVGARNAAAPPWEGRLVAFGASDAPASDMLTRNQRIQEVFLATRPYGATPLAGQLSDARDFLWYDNTKDPLDASISPADFGPKNDPLTLLPECRRNIIILLSDGEPNLDLRPFCENEAAGGRCPYKTPEDIAWELRTNPPNSPAQSVETVVIGFALSEVNVPGKGVITCGELTSEDCANNPGERSLQACCTLNAIAASGGKPNPDGSSKKAYFPRNNKELRQTFSKILSGITTSVTTRTSAVFASASQGNATGTNQFSSGFEPVLERPWRGKLTRTRIQCNALGVPQELPLSPNQGDDFAANVSSGSGPARKFSTYIPDNNPSHTVRPYIGSDTDGLGKQSGSVVAPTTANSFVASVPPAKMNVTETSCDARNATTCRDDILGWLLGKTNSEGESRCKSASDPDCSLFGAIFYANPVFVSGAPREYLQDETYAAFARSMGQSFRSSVLYVPTVDGMLHAMKTAPYDASGQAVDTLQNNELWAFLPPAVLPAIQSQYPNTPAVLLDGTPVIRDVPARTTGNDQYVYERRQADAQTATGTYRTTLVAGFGVGQVSNGYYAMDITEPDKDNGTKFLWQLTSDASGTALFGAGGTPAVTTAFIRANNSEAGADVAIAILPGGVAGTRTGNNTTAGPILSPKDATYAPAANVSSYTAADAARSLTIVRVDTGEVLRSFRATPAGSLNASRTTIVDIPAPMSGRPAVFPGATGSNADRAFVGDNEGRLWRLDMSKADPAEWTLEVFFDAFYDKSLTQRQPIELAPAVSVDEDGVPVVVFATGGQRVHTATANMINRVISVSDTFDKATGKFAAEVNWIETLGCEGACGAGRYAGERVTGPMELFGGTTYFASGIPATAGSNQCTQANHRVWAVDFVKSEDERANAMSPDPKSGPAGKWPVANASDVPPKSTALQPGIVFGVAIEQQPSCSTEVETPMDDPYLGYGNYTATTAVTPGNFFLVYQVGGVSGNTSGQVTTNKVQLEAPPSTVRFDSWAPLFE
jgi:type IV pilus assembly protein PilY1